MIADSVRGGTLLYGVGGLGVGSPFAVRDLRRSGEASRVDISISLADGPAPVPERRIFQWPGRYGLCLWRTRDSWHFTSFRDGTFVVSEDGSSIRCFAADVDRTSPLPGPGARHPLASAGLQHVLARRVLPRTGMLHGRTGLHAASVSDGRRAVVMVGASGAGKSTLSAALHHYLGWQVLADDISLIEAGDHSVCCFGVGTGTCLRADVLAGLQISATDSRPIPHQSEKRWCAADTESGPAATAVRAIVFLAQEAQDRIQLSRISPARALIKATARQVLFNPADLRARGALMNSLARVVERVPAYDFYYPRSFDCLPAVAARLRECLDRAWHDPN
jgi:hypothetical protein